MTLFAREAAADTPAWMLAHAQLSTPDTLIPITDPTVRQQLAERAETWSDCAERERDQTRRMWLLEDRPIAGGPLLYIAHRQTTPAAAWAWYRDMAQAPGHRVVLVDMAAPDRADHPLDTTAEVTP